MPNRPVRRHGSPKVVAGEAGAIAAFPRRTRIFRACSHAGQPVSMAALPNEIGSNALEKKNKDGKVELPDLRAGIHGEVTSGGLLGDGCRDPLAIVDTEVIVGPGSKLPVGQTTRE